MSIKITTFKTSGRSGVYQQQTKTLANDVIKKLVPRDLFTRGQLVFGTGNPYTLLNPQQLVAIVAESPLPLPDLLPPGVKSATEISDRDGFLKTLDQRWPHWRKQTKTGPGTPYEALVHLEMLGGWNFYAHAIGKFTDRAAENKTMATMLDMPVLCIKKPGIGMIYINPVTINRARIYHSNQDPFKPGRLFPLDPEDI